MKGGNTEITNAKEYHKLDMFHLQLMSKMMEQVQLLDQLLDRSVLLESWLIIPLLPVGILLGEWR